MSKRSPKTPTRIAKKDDLSRVAANPAGRRKSVSQPYPASRNSPILLTGGNPQIAKAEGNAPVQAYIAAMPDWKSDVGRRLDAIITRNVPGVRKAVRWNSPFYGIADQGWFLNIHEHVPWIVEKERFSFGACHGGRLRKFSGLHKGEPQWQEGIARGRGGPGVRRWSTSQRCWAGA